VSARRVTATRNWRSRSKNERGNMKLFEKFSELCRTPNSWLASAPRLMTRMGATCSPKSDHRGSARLLGQFKASERARVGGTVRAIARASARSSTVCEAPVLKVRYLDASSSGRQRNCKSTAATECRWSCSSTKMVKRQPVGERTLANTGYWRRSWLGRAADRHRGAAIRCWPRSRRMLDEFERVQWILRLSRAARRAWGLRAEVALKVSRRRPIRRSRSLASILSNVLLHQIRAWAPPTERTRHWRWVSQPRDRLWGLPGQAA